MPRLCLIVALLLATSTARAQPAGEVARVRAHLVAAREVVNGRDLSALSAEQRAHRAQALAVLDAYIARGVFPVRTDDAYPGLRPRFIDARGVHCAVGEMIAGTGHEDLARRINARSQYSYVREIDDPALLAWAHDYGFTVDELARIQPSYSPPPTPEGVEYQLAENKDAFTLACADTPPPQKVTLHLSANGHGAFHVTAAEGSDAFTRCFAAQTARLRPYGGAFRPSPEPFEVDRTLELRTPQQILEQRLREQVGFGQQCAPKPGALAKTAAISIASSPESGFQITVKTTPKNAAIEACIHDYLDKNTADFHGVSGLAYRHQVALVRMTSSRVQDAIDLRAPGFATDCYADGLPASVKITATAKADDKAFTLGTSSTNETFGRCLLDKLQGSLRKQLAVDGYFRIDNEIKTEASIAIESPAARDARLAKARKEAERQRLELERQIHRHKYGFE